MTKGSFTIRQYVAIWKLGISPKQVQLVEETDRKIVFIHLKTLQKYEYVKQ